MRFATLDYDVLPGGATEAVIHAPAVIVILLLLLRSDTPAEQPKEQLSQLGVQQEIIRAA